AVIGLSGPLRDGPVVGTVRIYGVLAVAAGLVSVARMGSNYNYLLEATALLAVFGGVGFTQLRSRLEEAPGGPKTVGRPSAILAVAAMVVLVSCYSLPVRTMWRAA